MKAEERKEWNIECAESVAIERFNMVYEMLVDETENKATLTNRRKNDQLGNALELMEYLRGDQDENPLDSWFS